MSTGTTTTTTTTTPLRMVRVMMIEGEEKKGHGRHADFYFSSGCTRRSTVAEWISGVLRLWGLQCARVWERGGDVMTARYPVGVSVACLVLHSDTRSTIA